MALPKILILHTGGTFGMDLITESNKVKASLPKLSPAALKRRFFRKASEISRLADCEIEILFNLDSAHIGPPEWLKIAERIRKCSSIYDGVVLLHGTDTLAFTAAALSFLLRPCTIPVVITGAQRPLAALRNDARSNLISAVEIAAYGPRSLVKRVTVLFGTQLYEGEHVRKKSTTDFAAFESPYRPPLASIGTTIRYTSPRAETSSPKAFRPQLSENVLMVHVTPGFPSEALMGSTSLISKLDALILVVFSSGTAPSHQPAFKTFLDTARKLGIPIILVTEGSPSTPQDQVPPLNYSAGDLFARPGFFRATAMTPECAYVKTCLILGQADGRKNFSRWWKR